MRSNGYFEYVLGNPGYLGENMFMVHYWLTQVEQPPEMDEGAFMAYNKMHTGHWVRVEQGIASS